MPQWQKSKGALIVTAALELGSNQVSHFHSTRKNTGEILLLLDKLIREYADRRTLFLTWDAAPWHRKSGLHHRASSMISMRWLASGCLAEGPSVRSARSPSSS